MIIAFMLYAAGIAALAYRNIGIGVCLLACALSYSMGMIMV